MKPAIDICYGIIQPIEKTPQSFKFNHFMKQVVMLLLKSDS